MSERTSELSAGSESSKTWRRALHAAVPAVWSWGVFAALCTVSLLVAPREQAVTVVGQRATGVQMQQSLETLQLGPADYLAELLDVLLFDFGTSYVLSPGTPALEVALAHAGPTLLLATESLVVLALLAAGVHWLASHSARATEALGYLLAVPAQVVVLVGLLVGAGGPGPGVVPTGATPGVVETILPALAVALPFVGGAARTLTHTGSTVAVGEWITDAWLHAGWFLVAVLTAEQLFGIAGLWALWSTALVQGSPPVLFAVSALFVLPFLLASVARSFVSRRGEAPTPTPVPGQVEPDGGHADATARHPTGRRETVGVALVGVALVAGLVGGSTADQTRRPGLAVGEILGELGDVAVAAVLAFGISVGVGTALALLVDRRRTAVRRVIEPLAVIPLPVLFGLAVVSAGGVPGPLTLGVLAGLSVSPFVFQRAAHDSADDLRAAASRGLDVAATGAGIAALLLADLVLVGFSPSALSTPGVAVGGFVAAATPVAIGFFLVGGDRRR